jgi:hypothetical protein
MMDNATFRENMNAVAVAASKVSTQANQAQEPGIHDLLACLGDLAKENRGLSYQIRDNLFGLIPTDGNSCENAIGCAKDAIEDSIKRLRETNDILRYVVDHL